MGRTTKISKQVAAAARGAQKASRKGALADITIGMAEAAAANGDKLPYGYVTKLLHELKPSMNWITRSIINKAFLKHKDDNAKKQSETVPNSIITEGQTVTDMSDLSGTNKSSVGKKSKGGRPCGTTNSSKECSELLLVEVKNEISKRFAAVQKSTRKGKRVAKGCLDNIINEVCSEKNASFKINPSAIRQRYYRKNLICHHKPGHISPLDRIEPTIIKIILQMARIRQSITPSRGLRLVNSLIENMPIQQELIQWKSKYSNDNLGTVGIGYWNRFIRRNKSKLVSKRGQKYELNRQNWTTYSNFVNMYDHVEDELVSAGLAKEYEEPVWMDRKGKIVSEDKAFGCKVLIELSRPDMCLVGDEVGGNLSMKGDGHVGGQLFLTAPDRVPQQKASSKNRKFTLIGLTALTGEPVMCIIIIEGKKPKGSIEAGIDINVNPIGEPTDNNFIWNNSGPGKYYPGGPVCYFRGKKIPPFVRWHESGSITSAYLKEALSTLDYLEVFDRKEDGASPFLLLDGHSSRLEMPFLQYINDPKDHWIACIGVPYGTALWQVGDSKEQNGSFNIALSKAKQKLLEKKELLGLPPSLTDTDMMPIINYAWNRSFARVDKNQQAITDRGWNPLNRALLIDNDIRATMTRQEKLNETSENSNVILPQTSNINSDQSTSATTITAASSLSSINNQQTDHDQLNFSHGTAAFCIDAIVSHNDLQIARERIKNEHQKGKTIREKLEAAKRVTSGIVFASGTSRLGKTVFDVCRENENKKKAEDIERIQKEEVKYINDVKKAQATLAAKPDINKMTIKELTIICKPLKRKGDGPMPNKKEALLAKYKEWNGRPPLSFDYDERIVNISEDHDNEPLYDDVIDTGNLGNMISDSTAV